MAFDFEMKQNDTGPSLSATLKDGAGTALDLTGATVRFHMRQAGSRAWKTRSAAVVVSAAAGTVRYDWVAGDTDTPGLFEAEFEVTFSGGRIETCPTRGYLAGQIYEDVTS